MARGCCSLLPPPLLACDASCFSSFVFVMTMDDGCNDKARSLAMIVVVTGIL